MLCIKVEKRTKLKGLTCLGSIPHPCPPLLSVGPEDVFCLLVTFR